MVRIKERYLLVNILYPDSIGDKSSLPDFIALNQPTADSLTPQGLIRGIKSHIHALFGDHGAGAVERSLYVKYLSNATSTFILCVTRDHFRLVWAALTFMDRVPVKNGTPCVFRVVRVSGTIRKIEEEAIRRAKGLVLSTREHMAGKSSATLDALFSGASQESVADVTAGIDDDTAVMSEDGGELGDEV